MSYGLESTLLANQRFYAMGKKLIYWLYLTNTKVVTRALTGSTDASTSTTIQSLDDQVEFLTLTAPTPSEQTNKQGLGYFVYGKLSLVLALECKHNSPIYDDCHTRQNLWPSQLSNLWWMSNSVCMGFGTAMRTGSSRRFKQYPTTYMWVSSWLPFTVD